MARGGERKPTRCNLVWIGADCAVEKLFMPGRHTFVGVLVDRTPMLENGNLQRREQGSHIRE